MKERSGKPQGGSPGAGAAVFRAAMGAIRLCLMGVASFLLVTTACVFVIPITSTMIAGATNVSYETDFMSACALWLLPSGAVSAVIVYGCLALIRAMNRRLVRAVDKVCARRLDGGGKKG